MLASKVLLKIGIIGASENEIQARQGLWLQVPGAQLTFYAATESAIEGVVACKDYEEVISQADIVDIIEASERTYAIFQQAVKARRNVFLDNPFVLSVEELRHCALLVKESAIKCQPGLYLRFHDDVAESRSERFRFLESSVSFTAETPMSQQQWLSLVNNHVDLLSFLAQAPIHRIGAFSLKMNNREHTLLNFRIQFDNGSVGNCTININAFVEEQLTALYNENKQLLILWSKNLRPNYEIFDSDCVINAMTDYIRSVAMHGYLKVTIFEALNTLELTRDIINQIVV